jgi:CofD-related protein of GAK system
MVGRFTRTDGFPDPVRLERYRCNPVLGPRILFFSGGSALRATARELITYTHSSIHIVTPFDSGGSSAKLRQAFRMPAVGDLRTRLLALADQSVRGNPAIFALFAHRFPKQGSQESLREDLRRMSKGEHPLVVRIPDPMRRVICSHFVEFLERMGDFDLQGASIGNLVLAAGYLANRRQLDPVILIFSKLVQALGDVRPVVSNDLHLAVELAGGDIIVGQHRITGKEEPPLESPIRRIWLVRSLEKPEPVEIPVDRSMLERILRAEMICYPMGSFYSSLVANLLPRGVGQAVGGARCPKVFIPNTGPDPELLGHDLTDQIEVLVSQLLADNPTELTPADVLTHVLIDSKCGAYPGGVDRGRLRRMGLNVLDLPLISSESAPLIDERLLVPVLLSLV